jgi:hypothetical protein
LIIAVNIACHYGHGLKSMNSVEGTPLAMSSQLLFPLGAELPTTCACAGGFLDARSPHDRPSLSLEAFASPPRLEMGGIPASSFLGPLRPVSVTEEVS